MHTSFTLLLVLLFSLVSRAGTTLYVSKLGDNSDGRSWATAYNDIQTALLAVPDERGGHRIVVRPDTYMEANLYPAYRGAKGAYNELIGDFDGRLGSGCSGWVIMDAGDAQKGFKSYDWWGNIRAYSRGWSKEHTEVTFSAIGWDRWRLRHLYATGGDGGLFFDTTDKVEPFTVVVEDSVSIGRAFGGGVANCLSRPDEPITFRRSHLWALDWWGDTSGAYVRVENQAMPERADVVFEDCVMVGPQCSLKGGNYGFKTFTRTLVRRCRMITLNFSQPQGTPTDGIVQSVQAGRHFAVDFEDCTLMGYKAFGVKVEKNTVNDLVYTTRGDCKAYVQYRQDTPKGFLRLGHWPAEVFASLAPPQPTNNRPRLKKEGVVRRNMCEVTPVRWKGRLCLLSSVRPASGGSVEDYRLTLSDTESGSELACFGKGHSLASAIVYNDTLYVYASRFENRDWNDVTLFRSSDLKQWESKVVIRQEAKEHLFNSSVTRGPNGFVMAYETNHPSWPAFTVKFARSKDLVNWTVDGEALLGTDRYAACPCIRYGNGYYYVLYLEQRKPRWFFEVYVARSRDLRKWEWSGANPVLTPDGQMDGINASDADLCELDGKTYLYYSVGDQRTWMDIRRAIYDGPMNEFLAAWFPIPGIPTK